MEICRTLRPLHRLDNICGPRFRVAIENVEGLAIGRAGVATDEATHDGGEKKGGQHVCASNRTILNGFADNGSELRQFRVVHELERNMKAKRTEKTHEAPRSDANLRRSFSAP